MSEEERHQQESVLKSSIADSMRVMNTSRPVLNSPAQVSHAGLLGVCLLFLAAMLTLAHLDSMLTNAVLAFAGAVPFLVWGYISASFEFTSVPGAFLARTIARAGQWVALVGDVGVAVGVALVIWHMSESAGIAFALAPLAALTVTLLVTIIFVVAEGIRLWRKGKPETSESDAPQV